MGLCLGPTTKTWVLNEYMEDKSKPEIPIILEQEAKEALANLMREVACRLRGLKDRRISTSICYVALELVGGSGGVDSRSAVVVVDRPAAVLLSDSAVGGVAEWDSRLETQDEDVGVEVEGRGPLGAVGNLGHHR